MYCIAGLNIPSQWPQVLVVLSTAEYFRHTISGIKHLTVLSHSKAGHVRPDSIPSTFLGRAVTPVHVLALSIPPLVYIGAVTLNGFQHPAWMARMAFPSTPWQDKARALACIASYALQCVTQSILHHLGDQWHAIGRRAKPRVVKTGPYAWVRHPGYSTVLVQQALWSVMFWSYAPLVALGISAAAFAIKMPIEEDLIQKDDGIREEYREYMKQVQARLIPYVW